MYLSTQAEHEDVSIFPFHRLTGGADLKHRPLPSILRRNPKNWLEKSKKTRNTCRSG